MFGSHKISFAHIAQRRAFTLVELLVVIAIIGLLSSVAIVGTTSAQVNARNAKRKADLLQISKALELYYNDNGSYPTTGSGWRGSCSNYVGLPDSDPADYPAHTSWIPGLTNKGYMGTLPRDPRSGLTNGNSPDSYCRTVPNSSCYLYISNGTDYVAMAYCTPEGSWPASDPFAWSGANPGREWRVVSQVNATTNGWY